MPNTKQDIKASFSVFLLALPLCLGIALASNFPPIAGIITAIVGGIISTFVGSSRLTIKGPAAGLIAVVLGAVVELGAGDISLGYKRALAVGVVAAVIQIILALLRLAVIAEIMPSSIIRGMLAAIGIIIVAKQSSVVLGVETTAQQPLDLLAELPKNLINLNPQIFFISLLSFLIIIFWPKLKKLSSVPASIVVLVTTIPLSYYFDISHEHIYSLLGNSFKVGPNYLINIPEQLSLAITFPDFSVITSFTSIKYIVMYALVGSIESLLTVCAVDNLNPEKEKSNLNRDLLSVGIGNFICSLIGGLPMISEIVRTKANIDYGAKTKYSNFFHAVFLLLSILLIPGILKQIPLAALAALLIYTGFKLAPPSEFVKAFKIGVDQFLLFIVTLLVTLVSDLLIGVASGIALKIVLHLIRGARISDFLDLDYINEVEGTNTIIKIRGKLLFSNFLKLKNIIEKEISNKQQLTIDLSSASVVDYTIKEKLEIYVHNGDLKLFT